MLVQRHPMGRSRMSALIQGYTTRYNMQKDDPIMMTQKTSVMMVGMRLTYRPLVDGDTEIKSEREM